MNARQTRESGGRHSACPDYAPTGAASCAPVAHRAPRNFGHPPSREAAPRPSGEARRPANDASLQRATVARFAVCQIRSPGRSRATGCARSLGECVVEDGDLIRCGVRADVTRPQLCNQDLAGVGRDHRAGESQPPCRPGGLRGPRPGPDRARSRSFAATNARWRTRPSVRSRRQGRPADAYRHARLLAN